ncbi:MAG TPA: YdeI/OmpD-associated family protein [Candidatus Doudnabacteria bacterium]|nr:YdeI/OmpD-associated family protein [Candidatus Doudnabacteria bacterium]
MSSETIKTGVNHRVTKDLQTALLNNKNILSIWNRLTPLARNEWICYITISKKSATREDHLKRLQSDLKTGKRRPCCWPGCPHRRPNAAKWFGHNHK